MTDDDNVLARIAALKTMPAPELRRLWQRIFETPAPKYNRRFLESRLAYRLQELVFGGLKASTVTRLEALGEQLDGGSVAVRRQRADNRPIAGTRLIREYRGVTHTVTVLRDGYEWQGRPFRSPSRVAQQITNTKWNGWTFFGLKNRRAGK